ncbi:MAG: hypothetical protein PHX20_08095, partial [Candidatus Omnitrophica bacterium]|nr:hypothetical protein [Candidatus Omnitrophota bacterium]
MKRLLTIILATFLIFSCGVQTYAAGGGEEAAKGRVASYWESLGNNIVHCGLCPRKCTIGPGTRGFCTARINIGGVLYTLGYGNPIAVHVDPIEKKPFFHVLPGTNAYSIAVAGCNMRCLFCQNW